MNDGSQDGSYNRSACTECQRRKQKCNREWPCNHCQKRKVAAKCRFNHTNPSLDRDPGGKDVKRKRQSTVDEDDTVAGHSTSSSDEGLGVENLGYMTGDLFAKLGIESRKDQPHTEQDWVTVASSPQLERALKVLPHRQYMDELIQNFFNNVNFHYYIIYPPSFLQEYHRWWDRRSQGLPISLQWTCLLIVVCACATQHLDADQQRSMEADLGQSSEKLAGHYQSAARELGNAIPVGHYHLYNVQRLLHWCYWYKSEAKFPESWHVLSSAVREAQELGFHKEPIKDNLAEFDREMRRRLWCIMDTWDWQISSGLCRPTIIDRSDCRVELPTLSLEDYSPSPLMHMKLQSSLIGELSGRFNAPKHIVTPIDVQVYQNIVERWMQRFPPVYSLQKPDRSSDDKYSWVKFHRYYIWTMGYLMMMNPIRTYMAKVYDHRTPDIEFKIRSDGVYFALKLMSILREWVDFASHRDGRFHFIIFSLFDTAAVLSTAIIKDVEHTIPMCEEIIAAIDNAVVMLRRLTTLSTTAKSSYEILSRLVQKVPRTTKLSEYQRKRPRVLPSQTIPAELAPPTGLPDGSSMAPEPLHIQQHARQESTSPNNFVFVESCTSGSTPQSDIAGGEDFTSCSTSYTMPPPMDAHPPSGIPSCNPVSMDTLSHSAVYSALPAPILDSTDEFGFVTIGDAELGQLSTVWDWQSLGLDFISSQSVNPGVGRGPIYHPYG